jgi:hypothetical protein
MRTLGLFFLLASTSAASPAGAETCASTPCAVVDDSKTKVTRIKKNRWRVEMFYQNGSLFARGVFRKGSTPSRVHWRPAGSGIMKYPSGGVLSRDAPGRKRSVTTYRFDDGSLFAKVRTTDHGPRVMALGKRVRKNSRFRPCSKKELFAMGPTWSAASHKKHYYGLRAPFALYCGSPATETLHSSWHTNGTLLRVRQSDRSEPFQCFHQNGTSMTEKQCSGRYSWFEIIN